MSIALLLIPLALLLLLIAVGAFFWAVDSGQFDDLQDRGASIFEEQAPREGGDARREGDQTIVTSTADASVPR